MLHQQVEHVLALLTPSNALAVRVSMHTGLRISDVLSLETASIKPKMWVREMKTGKCRCVGLPAPLRHDLEQYAGDKYIFPHRLDKTRHRTRQAVWRDIKRASKALRLPQNIAPHSARKIYAVDLMKKYGDIDRVQKVLRHKYLHTTMIYAMADVLLERGNRRKPYRGVRV